MASQLKPEDLLTLRLVGAPVVDPVRNRLYFVEASISRDDNQNQQHVGLLDLGAPDFARGARRLTAGPTDRNPVVSPDGKWLAFVSRRSGENQIWMLPLDGGEARQLTQVKGGVQSPEWLPDNRRLVALAALEHGVVEPESQQPSDAPEERFTRDVKVIDRQYYKLDGTGFFDQRHRQVVLVDVETAAVDVLTEGPYHHGDLAVHPAGRQVALVSNRRPDRDGRPNRSDLYLLDLDSHALSMMTDSGANLSVSLPSWSPDGKRLAFLASHPEDFGYGNTELWVWEEGRGVRPMAPQLDRPFGDVSAGDLMAPSIFHPVWSEDGQHVRALCSDRGRVHVWEVGLDGSARPLVTGDRVIGSLTGGRGGLALGWGDGLTASALSWWQDGRETPYVPDAPWPGRTLARPQRFTFHAAGGPETDGWVILPTDPAPGPIPVVVEVHGGPMSMYGDRMVFEFQVLAAEGWAVVYTNPRGSLGYGHAFCSAIIGEWGDKDYQDVMAGLDAALSRYPELDASRVGIAGGSYGGFMVNWAISHSDRFRAAVTMRSVVNRVSAMGTSDMGWLRVPQYGGRWWWEDPFPYWQQSPLKYASHIHTPVLIEHQEQDYRLPIEQGEQLYAALKAQGRETVMIRYPGESHGMSRSGKPWHRVYRLTSIVDWFRKHLV